LPLCKARKLIITAGKGADRVSQLQYQVSEGYEAIVESFYSMKDKATITFRRSDSGDIIGEVIDEDGKVLMTRNFGDITYAEIERAILAFREENPDMAIDTIELNEN
jgi:hypothetical protein